jgi:hypothetical protein
MGTYLYHRVESVERLEDDAIICFEDGRSAIYPASLLYAMIPQATEIPPEETEKSPSTAP